MPTATVERPLRTLEVCQEISIAAPLETVFAAVLEELGPGSVMPDGKPFPMKIEPWPGGRWFRDLGNNSGHLWGHVQVIKPPGLLELRGPMFMSYPAENFAQYRLLAEGSGTRLKFTHQAFGWIPEDVQAGVTMGWEHGLKRVRELAERRAKDRGASR
jgi:uncharacterized protein YndB with AHSA1/START domain